MAVQRELFQYILDASSLINIDRDNKMNLLRKRKGSVIIPQKVADEVAFHPLIRSDDRLRKFVIKYPELVAQFKNNEEEEYLRLRRQHGIHDADAAAIAMAKRRQLTLVIDDKKAKEKAENHGVETLTWQDFVKG